MNNQNKGKLYIFIAAFLWSIAGVLIKFLPWSAMSIVGARSGLAALVLAIYMKKSSLKINLPTAIGGLCVSLTTILFIFANKLTTSANAIVLQYTSPIFLIIFLAIFYKQRPRKTEIITAAVVIFGMVMFFLDKLSGGALLGNIFAILSGVTFTGIFLINTHPKSSAEDALLMGQIINAAIGIPFLFFETAFSPVEISSIIVLGILQLGIGYVFFLNGIKLTPPFSASLIATAEPILNPLWVMLFYSEVPGIFALIGGVIVITAITLYNITLAKLNKTTQNS